MSKFQNEFDKGEFPPLSDDQRPPTMDRPQSEWYEWYNKHPERIPEPVWKYEAKKLLGDNSKPYYHNERHILALHVAGLFHWIPLALPSPKIVVDN